jgi:anti-sigma factor RsiW
MTCNDVQEKIARGEVLSHDEGTHTTTCASCASVMADFSMLEAALYAFDPAVPAGFADRVMASVATEEVAPPRTVRRWVPLALAYGAGVLAAFNVASFLARVFVASVALGGTP